MGNTTPVLEPFWCVWVEASKGHMHALEITAFVKLGCEGQAGPGALSLGERMESSRRWCEAGRGETLPGDKGQA